MTTSPGEFWGRSIERTVSADTKVFDGYRAHIITNSSGGNIDAYLPDARNLRTAHVFMVVCGSASTSTVDVVDRGGTTILSSPLAADEAVTIYLADNSTSDGKWFARRDVIGSIPNPAPASSWFLFGGRNGTTTLQLDTEKYDSQTDSWSTESDMTYRRSRSAAASSGPIGYISGSNTGPPQNTAMEAYDPDSWTTKAVVPIGCNSHAAAVAGGDYWAVSMNNGSGAFRRAYQYVIGSDAWNALASSSATAQQTTAKAYGTLIHQFGGHVNTLQQYNFTYETSTDTWGTAASVPSPGRGFAGSMKRTSDDMMFLVGGFNGNPLADYIDDVDAYDPSGDSWSAKTDFPPGNQGSAATGSADGQIGYVSGGDQFGANDHYSYDMDTDTWSAALATLTNTKDNFNNQGVGVSG